MQSRVPRAMLQVYEPIVSVGYSAPELQTVCNRLGLVAYRMSYYAMRAAALGPRVSRGRRGALLPSHGGHGLSHDSARVGYRQPGADRRCSF